MKIAVTGGTGSWDRGVGPVIIKALSEVGHEVTNIDHTPPGIERGGFIRADLTDYGQTFAALYDHDAVVQLAANGEPDFNHVAGAARFRVNTLIAYNVFQAAVTYGIKRVVWASSETVLGWPYDKVKPTLLPTIDEDAPIPTSSYGISKAVTEDLARHMHRVYGTTFIGLRFSNIFYDTPGHVTGYDTLPRYWEDMYRKRGDLWAYVDARDIAQSVLKSLASPIEDAEVFTIAAADTLMTQTNEELLAAVYPGCRLRPGTGPHDTLIGIDKARRVLGYEPEYSWRQILGRGDTRRPT